MPKECQEALEKCYEEVDAIFRKWGVTYNPGCGCCGDGVTIKDKNGKAWEGDLRVFGDFS